MVYYSESEKATFDIGNKISSKIETGDIFLINGILGAGKSVLIRGIAKGLGIEEAMPSPTFTILNEYYGKIPVYHFDLYRISDPFELYEIGFEEYIYSNGVSFIEWPSKAGDLLPTQNVITVNIELLETQRKIEFKWKK